MLAAVPLPRLMYQLPELLNIAISSDVMAKYSAAFGFLLELRWHTSLVQQAIAANAKTKRSEEEGNGDALGFALVHVLNALMRYAVVCLTISI